MATASVNLADVSQFLVGSDTLKITPFFIRNFTIPSIAFAHPSMMTRSGVELRVGADAVSFNELNIDVILDSNFQTYFELLDLALSEVDFEHGSFATPEFDLWVQVLNANKELLFRVDFYHCRISSIGEIALDPSADLGSTLNVGISYDYWKYTRSVCSKELAIKDSETQEILDSSGCRVRPERWYSKPLSNMR